MLLGCDTIVVLGRCRNNTRLKMVGLVHLCNCAFYSNFKACTYLSQFLCFLAIQCHSLALIVKLYRSICPLVWRVICRCHKVAPTEHRAQRCEDLTCILHIISSYSAVQYVIAGYSRVRETIFWVRQSFFALWKRSSELWVPVSHDNHVLSFICCMKQ